MKFRQEMSTFWENAYLIYLMKRDYVLIVLLAFFYCLPSFGQYTLIDKARMAKEKGMYDAALKILDEAEPRVRTEEVPRLWFERASVLEGQYWDEDKSFEQLNKLLACYKYAEAHSQSEMDKLSCKEKLRQWSRILIDYGKKAYSEGNYQLAIDYFKTCEEIDPANLQACYLSGLCYFDQEKWPKAKEKMLQAIDGNYHATEAYRVMIHVSRIIEHDTRKAVNYAGQGLNHLPNDAYLREEMAMMLIHLGEFVKARPHLLWLIQRKPEDSEYLFNLARSYEESEELYTAEWFYENLLENEPQNFEAWYNLGVLNYNRASKNLNQDETKEGFGHLTKAMYAFEEASRIKPRNQEVMQNLYQVYKGMGLVEKARYLQNKMPTARMAGQRGDSNH
ncbi:MAG: tetratricopeptide repeat protein [Bacteroidia bacterium]|nr:tetratricopeptide repeat protein [Bacteroidia bacterium]